MVKPGTCTYHVTCDDKWLRAISAVRSASLNTICKHASANTAQVLHSDLKTKNILLTSSGTAKLGDVGLSEFLEHNFNSPDKIACALADLVMVLWAA